MDVTALDIKGAWLIHGKRFADDRGWFQEWFRRSAVVQATGYDFAPVQTNISKSSAGVIRGIHYSIASQGQGKLVTVMSGEIDDYVIDVRPQSSTFGDWTKVHLTADSGDAILLDQHLGHAFQSLIDGTVVSYLVTSEFNPDMEKAISPFCEAIGISWRATPEPVVSDKDRRAPTLAQARNLGLLPGL